MGALEGVKVLEIGMHIQGPQAALLLADWGAEVVKVELPELGDQSRWLPAGPGHQRSAFFEACNRGKRSVTIDVRVPEGRDLFLRLADGVDVVISNFSPGTMERWGLGYEDLAARNPSVVVAAGSSFGTQGPDAARPGADIAAQAMGGLISTTGGADHPPGPVGVAIADHLGAQNLATGIIAALFHRERSGQGQLVETSLLGGQVWAQASELTSAIITGRPAGQANRSNPMVPGVLGVFTTADGHLAIAGVAGPDRQRFYDAIGAPELGDEFPQQLYWEEDKQLLFPRIDAALVRRTTAEWCDLLSAGGFRFAPVQDHLQVLADPNAWDNGYLVTAPGPEGPVAVVAPPVRFSATPAAPRAGAPELGQHTEEVLLEIGLGWDDIAALRNARAI
jgi:crotonobetainyl-CoA:carnitine CoA-transferase CaiB-like acyl-CoA transferase